MGRDSPRRERTGRVGALRDTGVTSKFVHHRSDLARHFADALLGRSPFTHAAGLFLAGPRRTGKSTFLREDLVPMLEAEGVACIYVDLWADRAADPARLIADALARALRDHAGPARRLADRVGLTRLRLHGVEIDLDRIGAPDGVTLGDALAHLHRLTGGPVALIVDEAQHALSSPAGIDAMFALKAARDALNQGRSGDAPALILIFTGSHRDKLVGLLANGRQPFYGASVTDMPLLGEDYVRAYVDWLNQRLAPANRFDPEAAQTAFELLGHRPELLERALRDIALGPEGATDLPRRVVAGAEDLREKLWKAYDSDFGELTAPQRAVLAEIIAQGAEFQPFVQSTLAAVGRRLGRDVAKGTVQSALNELKEKGLVWQSGRGQYALEDQGMIPWLAQRGAAP